MKNRKKKPIFDMLAPVPNTFFLLVCKIIIYFQSHKMVFMEWSFKFNFSSLRKKKKKFIVLVLSIICDINTLPYCICSCKYTNTYMFVCFTKLGLCCFLVCFATKKIHHKYLGWILMKFKQSSQFSWFLYSKLPLYQFHS